MLTLGDRLKQIIKDQSLKKYTFADSLGVTPSYISLLLKGEKTNISNTLAKLIEEKYGYSLKWIIYGEGEKYKNFDLTDKKKELIKKINKMTDHEINSLIAFILTLKKINK